MKQVVLVTGASRGIGKATALAFARAGFDVAITGRTEEEGQQNSYSVATPDGRPLPGSLKTTLAELEATGAGALAVRMDLLDPASIDAAAEQVFNAMGRVDVLVNNAIYQGPDINSMFLDLTEETLDRVWSGYVRGPFRLTRLVLARMLEQGGGTIINISSAAGTSDPPIPVDQGGWGFAYGAGKAAFSRFAGVIATEHGGQGIRAFTVNPGVVNTETLRAVLGDSEIVRQVHPAAPELPARVLLWLATRPEADAHQRSQIDAQPFAIEHGIVV